MLEGSKYCAWRNFDDASHEFWLEVYRAPCTHCVTLKCLAITTKLLVQWYCGFKFYAKVLKQEVIFSFLLSKRSKRKVIQSIPVDDKQFVHFINNIVLLQVLSWFCKKGDDVLSKHAQHSATNLSAARLHEREFEKFYFTSMVSTLECTNTPLHYFDDR